MRFVCPKRPFLKLTFFWIPGKFNSSIILPNETTLDDEEDVPGVKATRVTKCRTGGCGLEAREHSFAFETEAWFVPADILSRSDRPCAQSHFINCRAECDFATIGLSKVFRQDDPELLSTLARIRRGICTSQDANLITSGGSIVCEPHPVRPLRAFA